MNGKLMVIALAFTACIGVYLLGDGITAMVASKNCCFPPNCPPGQLCDTSRSMQASPFPLVSAMWGGVILVGVIAILYAVYVSRRS